MLNIITLYIKIKYSLENNHILKVIIQNLKIVFKIKFDWRKVK
jgi:hypothetical protein